MLACRLVDGVQLVDGPAPSETCENAARSAPKLEEAGDARARLDDASSDCVAVRRSMLAACM